MFRIVCALAVPMILAILAGPLSFAMVNASAKDPSNLYLVVGSNKALDTVLGQPETREIGPYRTPFARLVHAPAELHSFLVEDGYWLFPATNLSEICGVQLPH